MVTLAVAGFGPSAALAQSRRQDGYVVDAGAFRLQFGALVQADGRFVLDDDAGSVTNTFLLRRVRPTLRASFGDRFEFYLNPDFAGGTLVVQDAYLDTRFTDAFRIRVGKSKTPFGLERLHLASSLLFYERALPTALVPNRDIGIQVFGDLGGGVASYAVGVLNGVPDGGSADVDSNDAVDVAGRIVMQPFARRKGSALAGLGAAMAVTAGKQSEPAALSSLRTASVSQTFFTYTGAAADGTRVRYSPQAFYYYRRFGGFAEFVHTEVPVATAAGRSDVSSRAWQAAASFVLSGEAATASGVRPSRPFNFGGGDWGAFQIALRYHELRVDDDVLALAAAAPGSSRRARAWTAGLNWYVTQNFKHVFNLERTSFGDSVGTERPDETAILFRTQVSF
ncbi:MAG TPA: porin [Vicinamibacterales bacterium]|nr:porin [Vicinamibacterales bacterium]